MATYETVMILKPALSDPEAAEFVEKTKKIISGDGGELINQEIWGRRKLTHMIGKAREGVYAYLKYKAAPGLLKKLNHNFSITDNIVRSVTVLAQDRKMREKPAKAKAKAKAAAAAPSS